MPLQSVRAEPVRGAPDETGRTAASTATLLILQGPVGGYFGALARQAKVAGHCVINVHLNLADRLFKAGGENVSYSGTEVEWDTWLEGLCRERKPDVIVLFGDRRPAHITACQVAERLDIPVYSFEEGYIRPDFVTFERGGNNARSPLPRVPLAYGPAFGPEPKVSKVAQSFWSMTAVACAYFIALAIGKRLYPHYRHHRVRPLGGEAANWLRNAARKLGSVQRDTRLQRRLVHERSKRFFVVALQVHDDLQAVHHGAGWTQERLIESAVRSFAAHAPDDAELVLRCHPYDRGHRSYGALVDALTGELGVQDRVHLMQSGHGPTLLMHAMGLVTVNSTMALSAMYHGCPVYALGDSFYRIPGLVAEGDGESGLAAFWRAPGVIDTDLYQAFIARLRRQALINGSFYRRRYWHRMTQHALRRLAMDGVGVVKPAVGPAVVPGVVDATFPPAPAAGLPQVLPAAVLVPHPEQRRAC